uniref:Uncharacterized protein n=1 Tax=Rhizophora mucronata TaxID=61149 RepID=A0A2P2Q7E6_RHIMU
MMKLGLSECVFTFVAE